MTTILSLPLLIESVIDKPYPSFHSLGTAASQHDLTTLVRKYLYYHSNPSSTIPPHQLSLDECPTALNQVSFIRTYNSATSLFYAPSNQCGPGGMFREVVRAVRHWGMGEIPGPRYDCVYVARRETTGIHMHNLQVARVHCFFSFQRGSENHSCALVHWYKLWRSEPDRDNGMYIVQPDFVNGCRNMAVISVDSIVRAAHLLPIFDDTRLDHSWNYTHSLNLFKAFYLNHFIDPHAYELIT